MIEIEVNGDALSGTEAGSGLLAAVAGNGRQQVRDLTHLTDRVIEGQRDEPESFLQRIVQLFYHAAAGPARLQTSITQSRRSWISIGRTVTVEQPVGRPFVRYLPRWKHHQHEKGAWVKGKDRSTCWSWDGQTLFQPR